jgi:hypothetical protein
MLAAQCNDCAVHTNQSFETLASLKDSSLLLKLLLLLLLPLQEAG